VQLDPEVRGAQAAVEEAGGGSEDVVGGQPEALGAAADRAQGLALVGGAPRRVIEGRQDGGELLLDEVGGGRLDVEIEDRFAGRAPALPGYLGESAILH
jgi:hypothetical protein